MLCTISKLTYSRPSAAEISTTNCAATFIQAASVKIGIQGKDITGMLHIVTFTLLGCLLIIQ
jgi:hypothetical protein